MNVRRERLHQTGSSNLAYPFDSFASPKQQRQTPKSISFSSLTKVKNVDDLIEKKFARGLVSPIANTQNMYASTGKLLRTKTLVAYPRFAQLEEKEKRKLAFVGESELLFDKKLEKYRDNEYSFDEAEIELHKKENLIKEKHNIHGNAVQETQLVGYDKYSADTLINNVDLEKVREAKRVLRRRYASRKNFFSIYNAWDSDHTGYVSLENVYNMCKKLGLNLNVDESRVLLASANKSGTGFLPLDEFLDLVYNKDDVLNVDLDQLAKNPGQDYLVKREELEREDNNLIKKLEDNAKQTREIKHMNQTNLVLKNHINQIASNLLEADPNLAGYVNFEKFEEAIKKLDINESIVSGKDIKNLFEKYKSDAHIINYKSFLDVLRKFHFQYDEAYKEQEAPNSQRSSVKTPAANILGPNADEANIVDCRTLPYHSMVTYLGKTRKVNRAIKRFFPNKQDFYDYLSDTLHVDKEKVEEKYVNRKELNGLINGLFSNFDEGDVVKSDFEGFLSSFVFNQQGDTNLHEVARMIYEEEESEFFHKINFKKKGPGPRREFANPLNEEEAEMPNNNTLGSPASSSLLPTLNNVNLDKLLQKIDDTFFVGSKKSYDVFKSFDSDKDGYISRKDLMNKIQDMAIMSKAEAQVVLDYVDPQNKGYVNFQEFSNKIRTNMVHLDAQGDFKVQPFVNPCKENFNKTAETVPQTQERIKKLIASVRPDNFDGKAKTRYGASPSWANTFMSFQAHSKSPMFASEAERFNRDRVKFQKEAIEKKKSIDEARLLSKQKFSSLIAEKVMRETAALDQLDQNRRTQKYLLQSQYEQRAKLFNSYV